MSKPDDIDNDLIEFADKLLSDAWREHDASFNPHSNSISDGLWGKFVSYVARAILSERTKAAELYKALREIAAHEPSDGNHNLNDLIAHASVKTASQAIRKGGRE